MKRDCTSDEAITKALVSCMVKAQLICVFFFANAKIRFSHDFVKISLLSFFHIESYNGYIVLKLFIVCKCVIISLTFDFQYTLYEPRHEKTGLLHMRNQRRRSASR